MPPIAERRIWSEWQLWLVVGLTIAIYLPRIGETRLTAEETRRAQIAREMMWTGDWIVPREQNLPFPSRPPLQNWLIAASVFVAGGFDDATVRMHSIIAMALIVAMTYAFCRRWMNPIGAMSSAVAFPTMGHVFQYGWLAETEPVYTLFVSGSLMVWRWLDARGGRPALAWTAGYALAAAGMLSKGPQAPVVFAAGVGLFLLVEGRWRELFRWQHFAGLAVFFALWGAWQVPFCMRVTVAEAWSMFHRDTSMRFAEATLGRFVKHLVELPFEVLVCMMPWAVLLIAYFRRDFRASIGAARTDVRFMVCVIGLAFAMVWVIPSARNRYFAPMYPCVATLIGLVVERCTAVAASRVLLKVWTRYVWGMCVVVIGIGVAVLGVTLAGLEPKYGAQPFTFAVLFAATSILAAAVLAFAARRGPTLQAYAGTLVVAAFLGLAYKGAVYNTFVATRVQMTPEIVELKRRLPPNAQLVSLGVVTHTFAYYYGEPIRLLPAPPVDLASLDDWTYFCIDNEAPLKACNFPYELVAQVKADSNGSPINPKTTVMIARRLPATAAAERDARQK